MAIAIGPDHGRSSRARLYAAGRARPSVIAVTSRPIQTVFQTKVGNCVLVNR